MALTVLPKPQPRAFEDFVAAQAAALRASDEPVPDLRAWKERRASLREAVLEAMGPLPTKPCPLEPRVLGTLQRPGYDVERLVFQSRPDVWVTANAYVPRGRAGKAPAVLAVHGHWALARRDPVVQARCVGLAKLGFFVLAVDAFGAGERYTHPSPGSYHGALYGATLWPVGQSLLGAQVYDNRRAVDYLLTRPEVDGRYLGITGASGGGNQTMYASALDERFRAAVPVCSVGNYQAYLHVACCVCEVLPGALRFTEEGDVLAMTAPRALLTVTASRDGRQYGPVEAKRSAARARAVYDLYGEADRFRHQVFESEHAYNQPMREAMYGWMRRWLQNEGDGRPVPEPAIQMEKPEDLACYPGASRPRSFLLLPAFAAREAREAVARSTGRPPRHAEEWESAAVYARSRLRKKVFGDFPPSPRPTARLGAPRSEESVATTPVVLSPEPGMPVPFLLQTKGGRRPRQKICLLLDLAGKAEAVRHPLAAALLDGGWTVVAPDLRATGETRPDHDAVATAQDHNSAEHAVWIGRPLLGQWVFDVSCLLDWLALQPDLDRRRVALAGLGPAGVVALCAAGLFEDRIASCAAVESPATFVTEAAYGPKFPMGLLAPGILQVGDVAQLAALVAPRPLVVSGGLSPQGVPLKDRGLRAAYAFTRSIYATLHAAEKLTLAEEISAEAVADAL